MRHFLLLLLLSTTIPLHAQLKIEWQKQYGGIGDEQVKSIIQTTDGGYIAIGTTRDSLFLNPTVWVIKMDAAGEIQWQKVMRDTIFYSHLILGSNIEQTQDGGYVFAMSFLWPPGTFVCQVVKLYSNGSIQWIKSYPAGRTGLVIHQTPDGGYLVGGDGFNNYLLFKIDKLGKQLWARTYGGSSLENFGDMCLTLDNGCIITGSSWSDNGDVTGHHGPGGNNAYPDYWVVKLDSAGTLEWERSLGGIYVEQSYDILQTSKEEYLVCGITTSNDGDVSGHHGVTGDAPDAWLVKLDQQGAIIWQKCLGGTLYVDDIHSILEVPDGGYILAGGTASNDGNVSGTPHGDTDAWILKLNTDGHIEWQNRFGGSEWDESLSMVATADGGFIFGGVSLSLDGDVTLPAHGTPPLVYGDYWIVKLSMVSGTDEYTYEPLRIAPNPSSGNITISSDENDPIRFITVFDMLGQPLLQQQIGSDLNIEISALPAGVYLMMGETKSGKMLQGKVVCNR